MTSVCNIANIVGLGRAAQRVLTAQLNGVSLLYSNTNYFAESEEAGGLVAIAKQPGRTLMP